MRTLNDRRGGLHLDRVLAMALGTVPLAICSNALADRYWMNGVTADTWSNGNDWSAVSADGTDNAGAPGSGDNVYITNTDALNEAVTLDQSDTILSLAIGNSGGGTDTLWQTGGFNLSMGSEQVGVGTNSVGAHSQIAGTNTYTGSLTIGSGTGSFGVYNLGGSGSIEITSTGTLGLFLGYSGAGTFNQTGGDVTVKGDVWLGYNGSGSGTYLLGGTGALNVAGNVTVGGTGATYASNGAGTFAMSGGSLVCGGLQVLNDGAFTQQGGVVTVGSTGTAGLILVGTNSRSIATYALDGPGSVGGNCDLIIGGYNSSIGTFNESAGSVTCAAGIYLGLGATTAGTYSLSGTGEIILPASASSPGLFVGYGGFGSFDQNGGSVSIPSLGSLCVGRATGNYFMTGGTLTNAGSEYIGLLGGVGTFNQSGGIHTIGSASTSSALVVGFQQGTGTFLLGGNGSLTVYGSASVGFGGGIEGPSFYSGSGTFIQSGGSLNVTGSEAIGGGSFGGTFLQQGGINSTTYLEVGNNGEATYVLSGGTLTASGGEYVLAASDGGVAAVFEQTGGTQTISATSGSVALGVGYYEPGYHGSFSLSGGSVYVQGTAEVGISGTLIQSGGLLTASEVDSTGTFALNGGTLSVAACSFYSGSPLVVGNGSSVAALNLNGGGSGGSFSFAQGLTISADATLNGGGTITGYTNPASVNVYGTIAPMASMGSMSIQGSLTLESPAVTLIQRVGSTPSFGTITCTGNIALAGVLAVYEDAANEATTTSGQSFVILQTSGGVLSGAFSNIASGQELTTTDGTASFVVTVNQGVDGDVVLSDFQMVPEPGMVGVIGALGMVAMRKRRKVRS